MSRTLSARLTRWYIGSFLLFLGLSFSVTWVLVEHMFNNIVEQELIEDHIEFREIYHEDGIAGVADEIAKENGAEGDDSEFIRLLSPQGKLLSSTDLSDLIQFDIVKNINFNNEGYMIDERLREAAVKTEDAWGSRKFLELYGRLGNGLVIHIGEYPEGNIETLHILRNSFLLILFFSIPLAIVISRRSVRTSVSGITEITATAKRIRQGFLDDRVQTHSTDTEIATLESAFNSMLDRISELVTEIQEMTDNIAHDLKSPLARIRFMSEVSLSKTLSENERDESAAQTIDECDRLIKMIDTALDVAEAQAGLKNHKDALMDISALVTAAVELFEPVAEQNHIRIVSKIQPGCAFIGGLESIQRTVSNLIDNAIKYSGSGDTITVTLEYDREDLNLIVSDTGIGIRPRELQSIFKRFYRCDRTRSTEGCGLGLSYCRAVARRAGGNIQVNSVYGSGSKFTLRLPVNTPIGGLTVPLSGEETDIRCYHSTSDAIA